MHTGYCNYKQDFCLDTRVTLVLKKRCIRSWQIKHFSKRNYEFHFKGWQVYEGITGLLSVNIVSVPERVLQE
jgi:hypothetical protein